LSTTATRTPGSPDVVPTNPERKIEIWAAGWPLASLFLLKRAESFLVAAEFEPRKTTPSLANSELKLSSVTHSSAFTTVI
jgi:hypothetical protein